MILDFSSRKCSNYVKNDRKLRDITRLGAFSRWKTRNKTNLNNLVVVYTPMKAVYNKNSV